MFKEYDKNTYKEKKIKDRTPIRNGLKKAWNDTAFWRGLVFSILIILLIFLCKVNSYATESTVYVDESYLSTEFGNYKFYAIVTDGAGNYATIYTNGKMIASTSAINSLMSYDEFGFKTMKLEDDYLVRDESGASYDGRSSVTISFNTGNYGLATNMKTIIYANQDIYTTQYSNTGSPSASSEVFFSTSNNIGAKPVEEPTETTPDVPDNVINVSVDLTEVIKLMESIELCCKSIFSIISMVLFFLVAEWTANKIKNIVRRFSRYE